MNDLIWALIIVLTMCSLPYLARLTRLLLDIGITFLVFFVFSYEDTNESEEHHSKEQSRPAA